jgi:hypothetical protein
MKATKLTTLLFLLICSAVFAATIAEQLTSIDDSKDAIKAAIEAKGVTVGSALLASYSLKISEITGGGEVATAAWAGRPSDWLPMPDLPEGVERIAALFGVASNSPNYVAFSCTGITEVNWGDGTATETVTSGVTAEHSYSYASMSASTTTSSGIRQAILVINPQAGQHITTFTTNKTHSKMPSNGRNFFWLEMAFRCPAMTSIPALTINTRNLLAISWYGPVSFVDGSYMLSSLWGISAIPHLDTAGITTLAYFFRNNSALTSVPMFDIASSTLSYCLFDSCVALITVPALNFSRNTNGTGIFNNCTSLAYTPPFNMASTTTSYRMFYNCTNITSIGDLDLRSATDFSEMFRSCGSLQILPDMRMDSATSMAYMCMYCYSLQGVPPINAPKVTTLTNAFEDCWSLVSVPDLKVASATSLYRTFFNNQSLATVTIYAPSVNYMVETFRQCSSLESLPMMDTSNVANFYAVCYGDTKLKNVPAWNMSSATELGYAFGNCPALESFAAYGARYPLGLASCNLSASAINTVFTNLGNAISPGATAITVSGNPGYATCDPSIATAKGWVVN